MRKILVPASVFILTLSMGSCVEEVDNDRANGILSVSQNGVTVIDAYDLGSLSSIDLSVAKGGLQDNGGMVTFKVDQALLDSLNNADGTSYQMLPGDCYSLENETFNVTPGGDRHVTGGKLIYDPKKINALCGFEKKQFAIALKATSTGTAINSTRSTAFYIFNIKEAIVNLISTGGNITVAKDGTVQDPMPLKLQLGFQNQWDLTTSFAPKSVDYVNNYNAENGTFLSLLPTDCYTITNATIGKGKNTANGEVKLNGVDIAPGNYLLPVSISSMSGQGDASIKFNATTVAEFFVSKLGSLIDRTDWVVTGSTEEETGEDSGNNGRFKHLIDGDKSTFWHSHWSQPTGEVAPPYRITVDMGKVNDVSQLGLLARQNALTTMNVEIYAGQNETEGTLIGKYYFDGSNKAEQIVPVKACETRYVCLYIPSLGSGSKVGHMAELYIYGTDK